MRVNCCPSHGVYEAFDEKIICIILFAVGVNRDRDMSCEANIEAQTDN